ncbi:AAA family ATPase, partial [Caldimonas sp.]
MPLPIVTADQRLAEKRCAKVALVGAPGVGKTSQIRTLDAERTLLVDTEAGDLS